MAMAHEPIDPAIYGERWAEVYDDIHEEADPSAVAFLADLAHGGRALELGIGTGRFALPLAATGVSVEGIDLSESMVAKLRAKPGGEAIPVTIGDFADVARPGPFDLIFVVFNTFFGLLDQATQVRCFGNVASGAPQAGRCLPDRGVRAGPGAVSTWSVDQPGRGRP